MGKSSSPERHSGSPPSESTPLLQDQDNQPKRDQAVDIIAETQSILQPDQSDANDEDKPLPRLQIALICYARLMEPIGFFCILPYIAQMVQLTGNLPETEVGYYSGPMESLFSVTQALTFIFWSRLADRIGRKPALIYSLSGMVVMPILFGLSGSIAQMIIFRSLAGVFSGSSLILRNMIGDHSTTKTQAVAYSYFAFAGNIGIVLGPMIGGFLANPAAQYPGLFGGIEFFEKYPFALPGFAVGGIAATGVLTTILFLEETLPPKKDKSASDENGQQQDDNQEDSEKKSMYQLLKVPGVAPVMVIYQYLMLLGFSWGAIMPVFLYTGIEIGGVGFSNFQISIFVSVQGIGQTLWMLLAFPRLHKRFGNNAIMWACAWAWPFSFVSNTAMNLLARGEGPGFRVGFWIAAGYVALLSPGVAMAFTGAQLALNDVSPSPRLLGTLNAIAMTMTSIGRAFVPALATALYALGVQHRVLGGNLAWIIYIPIGVALLVPMRWLPPQKK